jgi:hypothetical protein
MVTKVKPNINSVEIHPQLNNNGHPMDGALVGGLVHCGQYYRTDQRWDAEVKFFFFFFFFLGGGLNVLLQFYQQGFYKKIWSYEHNRDQFTAVSVFCSMN